MYVNGYNISLISYVTKYVYVISFALSTPMAIGLIVSLICRAYIIISFIYYVCIIAPALISHPFTNMHQKNDSNNNLFSE